MVEESLTISDWRCHQKEKKKKIKIVKNMVL